jgi:hypothetical protein
MVISLTASTGSTAESSIGMAPISFGLLQPVGVPVDDHHLARALG